LVLRYVC